MNLIAVARGPFGAAAMLAYSRALGASFLAMALALAPTSAVAQLSRVPGSAPKIGAIMTYGDSLAGFTVSVPAAWSVKRGDHGVDAFISSPDGDLTGTISGELADASADPIGDAFAAELARAANVDYQRLNRDDGWFVVSGRNGTRSNYVRVAFGTGSRATASSAVRLEYSHDREAEYEAAIGLLSRSFRYIPPADPTPPGAIAAGALGATVSEAPASPGWPTTAPAQVSESASSSAAAAAAAAGLDPQATAEATTAELWVATVVLGVLWIGLLALASVALKRVGARWAILRAASWLFIGYAVVITLAFGAEPIARSVAALLPTWVIAGLQWFGVRRAKAHSEQGGSGSVRRRARPQPPAHSGHPRVNAGSESRVGSPEGSTPSVATPVLPTAGASRPTWSGAGSGPDPSESRSGVDMPPPALVEGPTVARVMDRTPPNAVERGLSAREVVIVAAIVVVVLAPLLTLLPLGPFSGGPSEPALPYAGAFEGSGSYRIMRTTWYERAHLTVEGRNLHLDRTAESNGRTYRCTGSLRATPERGAFRTRLDCGGSSPISITFDGASAWTVPNVMGSDTYTLRRIPPTY